MVPLDMNRYVRISLKCLFMYPQVIIIIFILIYRLVICLICFQFMGSLTIIFILELVTGFVAFFFVDKVGMAIYVRIICLSSLEEI